ncbi:MAG TPA: 2'-5' RNA ligase family protein [Actinoplanes sp.]|jgi:2'-5' RNA ligase
MAEVHVEVDALRDHWWWRPGWAVGRHFYACHFSFHDQPAVRDLASAYQNALQPMDGLDLIPSRWLHLTLQGVGFTDDIPLDRIERFAEVATHQLATVVPPTLTFHRPVVRPEAVYLPAGNDEPVNVVRAAVRAAMVKSLPGVELDDVKGYRPHVSVAYSNAEQPAAPIAELLARVDVAPVTVTLTAVQLMRYHRDKRMYEWAVETPLTIGAGT